MRIDHKNLRKWLQDKLDYYSIDWKVEESYSTRFSSDQIQSGACRMVFICSSGFNKCSVLCFYDCTQLRELINSGYSLTLKLKDRQFLDNAEIDVTNHRLNYIK